MNLKIGGEIEDEGLYYRVKLVVDRRGSAPRRYTQMIEKNEVESMFDHLFTSAAMQMKNDIYLDVRKEQLSKGSANDDQS